VQRLTLHLHPADLGAVQVVATMDDGTVSLQLMAGNATTRDALRASLPSLRNDLAAAGLDGTHLDVSDQPPSQHGAAQHQPGTSSDGSPRSFTGNGSEGRATNDRPRGNGPTTTPVAADVPRRRFAPDEGVDLRL
jgi:flagellar hook-length control protein FliK